MDTLTAPDLESPRLISAQIQTQSRCNGACIMCPYDDTSRRQPQGTMEWGLFTKIVDELASLRSFRAAALAFQNEPLLDRRLSEAVAYVRAARPDVVITLATNGQLLDRVVLDGLVDAGLTTLIFSVNALTRKTFERVERGLDFDRVMANLVTLRDGPPVGIPVHVKMLVISENEAEMTSPQTAFDFVLPLRRNGVTVSLDPISNRAGSLAHYDDLVVRAEGQSSHHKAYCDDLFNSLNVLFNGDVLGCCADWEREAVIGNLSRSSVRDVWTGDTARRRRRMIAEDRYGDLQPCRTCSQAANILGARAAGMKASTEE